MEVELDLWVMGFCKQIHFHSTKPGVEPWIVDFSEESFNSMSSKREILYLSLTFAVSLNPKGRVGNRVPSYSWGLWPRRIWIIESPNFRAKRSFRNSNQRFSELEGMEEEIWLILFFNKWGTKSPERWVLSHCWLRLGCHPLLFSLY